MNERQSDFEWLQQFARAGNQSAFRDLVRRHIDLVFATALRKVGDTGGAEEISQNVFGALAKKAWRFAPDDSLPAWLHKTTLLESQSWLRGEMRRRRREQTAAELGTTMKTPDEQPAFQALVPLLDEALLSLREKDREALLLRYYESQSLRDVGAALGVSDDTAQKRVQTALEKLAQFFQRRGVKTATVAATAAALQHTASSATAATVSLVCNAAIQAAPPALAGLSALLARFANLTKMQTAAVCAVIATAAVTWQWREQNDLRARVEQAQNTLAAGQTELATLETELAELQNAVVKREAELAAANDAAATRAASAQNLAAKLTRLRERLLATDYHWPEDLSFVRIPKAVGPELNIGQPILRPGKVASETRELLGLSPEERQQADELLQQHYAVMDQLVQEKFYQTNSAPYAYIPKEAEASNVWVIPQLGDAASQQAAELKAGLENVLHGERWTLIKRDLDGSGMGALNLALGLGTATTRAEVSGWLLNNGGDPVILFHATGGISERGGYWSSGMPAISVRALLSGDFDSDPAQKYASLWLMQQERIPDSVRESMLAWARRVATQAVNGGGK